MTGVQIEPPDKSEGATAEGHAAHLEEALLQARALIESTVSLYRRRPAATDTAAPTDIAALGEALDRIVGGARHSVSVALAGPGEFTDSVLRLLAAQPPAAAVRLLGSAEVADASFAGLRQPPGRPLEARVSESELREIVVVDGVAALVRGAARSDAQQATVVNDVAAVRALELLFAGAWARGRRLADHLGLSPRLRSELTRSILERLRAGHTDDTAARDLNVSLRTYRRHVAEIMRELDASSRFQAGARAVELGLLSE
ncbi:DNA-binding response regulator [Streptomyces sp. NPDC087866]|uniref:helix-turn-helix transcriptional regulator n=1 Tax=unclassified Streptomyces TaxID=2593676 RepID=UPI00225B7204|nr:DNA-binding response regulator [Streptomyces sp. NBC_01789]MCX4446078.1 DNA-binding response regulator [Streptomyces sp. NBC_01789]